VVDSLESGNLARNNYQGIIYAVPTNPLPSEPACDKRAAAPLSVTRCQIAQTLPDGTPNPNARFVQAGCETGFNTGNLPGPSGPCNGAAVTIPQGRNRFRGPNYFNTDFTVMKITKLRGWEGATLGVGLQFFNFFNHPNFGFPRYDISDSTFGQIFGLEQPPTSVLGTGFSGGNTSARMIQLKAEFKF